MSIGAAGKTEMFLELTYLGPKWNFKRGCVYLYVARVEFSHTYCD